MTASRVPQNPPTEIELLQRGTATLTEADNDVAANANAVRTIEEIQLWLGWRGMPDGGGRCTPIDISADRSEYVTIPTHACDEYVRILFGVSPDKSGGAVYIDNGTYDATISDFGRIVSDSTDPDECVHWEVTLQMPNRTIPAAPGTATIQVDWTLPPSGNMRIWYLTWAPGQQPAGEVTV